MKVIMGIYFLLAFLSMFSIWGITNQKISFGIGVFGVININAFDSALIILGAIVVIAVLLSVSALGSGLQGESTVLVFKTMAFLTPFCVPRLSNIDIHRGYC
jgi:hypothetical protein